MTAAGAHRDFKTTFHMNSHDELDPPNSAETFDNNAISESPTNMNNINENIGATENSTEVLEANLEENSENVNNGLKSAESSRNSPDENSSKNEDEWLDIMGCGSFKKKVIKPGPKKDTRPNLGDVVTVSIVYYQNEVKFEENENLRFIVGDLDVIQGLDLVIRLMETGEVAKVIIPSKLAYGKLGRSPDVPPDCDLECDIELKDVEPVEEESLSVLRRLQLGNEKRSRGNTFYERCQYIDALHCYERAAEYLDGIRDCSDSSPEQLQEVVDMRLKVYNNMAASHLKLSAFSAALKSLDSVLKVQPQNVKALFRKGRILGMQGSTDDAISCMKTAANLEPDTKVIQVELTKLKNQKKKEEQVQKAMYQRMFKSDPKPPKPTSWLKKWSIISCGVLAVAVGSAFAYRQFHT